MDQRVAIVRAAGKDLFELIEHQEQPHLGRAVELLTRAYGFARALQRTADRRARRFRRPPQQHGQAFRAAVIALRQFWQGIGGKERVGEAEDRIIR